MTMEQATATSHGVRVGPHCSGCGASHRHSFRPAFLFLSPFQWILPRLSTQKGMTLSLYLARFPTKEF
jgi:hypothetical protein